MSLSFNNARRYLSRMYEQVPLSLLRAGQSAFIDQVMGQADHVQRLEEMGMRAGTSVEMVQPGSPCIVRLGGSKLCFRDSEAMGVLVRLGDVA